MNVMGESPLFATGYLAFHDNVFVRIIEILRGPNPNWVASASTAHISTDLYGAHFAIDGLEVDTNTNFWNNDEGQDFGWFQLDLGEEYFISAVNITYRLDWTLMDFIFPRKDIKR